MAAQSTFMEWLGVASYGSAAAMYALLGLLLVINWRGNRHARWLLTAAALSTAWGLALALVAAGAFPLARALAVDPLRSGAWLGVILSALASASRSSVGETALKRFARIAIAVPVVVLAMELLAAAGSFVADEIGRELRLVGHVAVAVLGLGAIEQYFRNTPPEQRRPIELLCLALGTAFAFDLVLYSQALLVGALDRLLWEARGLLHALTVPLLAVSAVRHRNWAIEMHVSRSVVFRSTALIGSGLYLLVMASVGYYIRDYGGEWGRLTQILFVVGALMLLGWILFSGRLRAEIKVLFSKHFFSYKYDYRREWLELNRVLSSSQGELALRRRCVKCVADIVDSTGGVLWLREQGGDYAAFEAWPGELERREPVAGDSSMVRFFTHTQWVIDVPETLRTPEIYQGMDLPEPLRRERVWLIVPLFYQGALYGFIELLEPRAARSVNWEDHDLLKTVGLQIANYLALYDTSLALAEARQFEAYNRLSAFTVHDLKNVIAQLSLISRNAETHRANEAFIDDALATVASAVERMSRLLAHLEQGSGESAPAERVAARALVERVLEPYRRAESGPSLSARGPDFELWVDRQRLETVLNHLLENAIEAVGQGGEVTVTTEHGHEALAIEVADDGPGMSEAFIRERLFRPFDTTKGNAGMGIGVYESRQLIEAMGGRLSVTSDPGCGSRFRIVFERRTSEPPTPEAPRSEHEEASEAVTA